MVVLKSNDVDILAVRAGNADLTRLREGVVEVLDLGVELLVEAALYTLEDVVGGGLVTRQTEGSVAAVVAGDLVQVPEVALESGDITLDACINSHRSMEDSLLGLDVGLCLVCCKGIGCERSQREQRRGKDGGGFHRVEKLLSR